MAADTLSALAAWAAAAVALTGAAFQLFAGCKQASAALLSANAALKNSQNAGRHKVAEFRQAWINRVIDTLCDHHAIVSAIPAGQPNLLRRRTKAGRFENKAWNPIESQRGRYGRIAQ